MQNKSYRITRIVRMFFALLAQKWRRSLAMRNQIRKTLNAHIHPVTNLSVEVGQRVIVAREGSIVAAGPFRSIEVCEKQIFVHFEKGTASNLILHSSALILKSLLKYTSPTYRV